MRCASLLTTAAAVLLLALVLVPWLGGCGVDCIGSERCGCEGHFVQVREFPGVDTLQLQLREEPYRYAIYGQGIFDHTGGQGFSYRAGSSNREVVVATASNFLFLTTKSIGLAEISLSAYTSDDCGDSASLSFYVEVIDTTASGQ